MRTGRLFGTILASLALGAGCQLVGNFDDIELQEGPVSCTTVADCVTGQVCLSQVCVEACEDDSACAAGERCSSSGGCVPAGAGPDASASGGSSGAGSGGSGGAGAAGGASGSGGGGALDAGVGGAAPDGGGPPPLPPCDESERPRDELGIFVAASGTDASSGTRTSPVRTIAQAILRAKAAGRGIVYLAPGPAYEESVVLEDLDAGLTLRGGWTVTNGTEWAADCREDALTQTVIQQPLTSPEGTPAVTLRGDIGSTRLWNVTIETKLVAADGAAGEGGESLIGVHVAPGTLGSLTFDRVLVRANPGGAGGAGVDASDAPPALCAGQAGCIDGADGVVGVSGTMPSRGQFSPTGFIPGAGGLATTGTYGQNGFLGALGAPVTCNTCSGANCGGGVPIVTSGGNGTCGCGGPSGDLGQPGGGGGASVGMLVGSADVSVVIRESELVANAGGDGGGAGATSDALVGTSGVDGAPASCRTCGIDINGICNNGVGATFTSPGGPAGTDGGLGGTSGTSAGGVGGPAYALVTVGPASVTVSSDTLLTSASGGASADGSTADSAGRYDQPDPCGNGVLEAGEQCDDGNVLDDDACRNDCSLNCTGPGEVVDPESGTCYLALPVPLPAPAARALCRNQGPGWDIMVPSTASTFLTTRKLLPSVPLHLGARVDATGTFWESMSGAPVVDPIPFTGVPPAFPPLGYCLFIDGAGNYNQGLCADPRAVLCERRIDAFQTADCGDGDLDQYEECDDGNTEDGDGCTQHCTWACPDGGTIVVESASCYRALAAGGGNDKSTWAEARAACQLVGDGWDLPQFETTEEPGLVSAAVGPALGYWAGATNGPPGPDASVGDWAWIDLGPVDLATWPSLDGALSDRCAWVTGTVVSQSACGVRPGFSVAPVCEWELP